MNRIRLIADVPHFTDGHRLLVSSFDALSESDLSACLQEARKKDVSIEPTWIAVCRQTNQKAEGIESNREVYEVLLLLGNGTSNQSQSQCELIVRFLKDHLEDVPRLATSSYTTRRGSLYLCPQLGGWLVTAGLLPPNSTLASSVASGRDYSQRQSRATAGLGPKLLIFGALGVFVVIVITLFNFLPQMDRLTTTPESGPTPLEGKKPQRPALQSKIVSANLHESQLDEKAKQLLFRIDELRDSQDTLSDSSVVLMEMLETVNYDLDVSSYPSDRHKTVRHQLCDLIESMALREADDCYRPAASCLMNELGGPPKVLSKDVIVTVLDMETAKLARLKSFFDNDRVAKQLKRLKDDGYEPNMNLVWHKVIYNHYWLIYLCIDRMFMRTHGDKNVSISLSGADASLTRSIFADDRSEWHTVENKLRTRLGIDAANPISKLLTASIRVVISPRANSLSITLKQDISGAIPDELIRPDERKPQRPDDMLEPFENIEPDSNGGFKVPVVYFESPIESMQIQYLDGVLTCKEPPLRSLLVRHLKDDTPRIPTMRFRNKMKEYELHFIFGDGRQDVARALAFVDEYESALTEWYRPYATSIVDGVRNDEK